MGVHLRTLGKNIRAMRDLKGMTQEALSKKVNISLSHYSNMECGNRAPRLDTLDNICLALGCAYMDVLHGAVEANVFSDQMKERVETKGYGKEFDDIIAGCSENSVRLILEACRKMAAIDKNARR